jgi:hypothetical protein
MFKRSIGVMLLCASSACGQTTVTWDTALSTPGFNAPVRNFWIDGSNTLHAMGQFSHSGVTRTGAIAKRVQGAWQPLGSPLDATWVESLAMFDSGDGPQLHVAGGGISQTGEQFGLEPVVRLVGDQWRATQPRHGANWSSVIAAYRVQGVERLFVCGPMEAQPEFLYMSAWMPPSGAPARWDVIGGEPFSTAPEAMLVTDLGDGEKLYFGGGAGEVALVGSFDGQTWRRVGGDVDMFVRALAVLPAPSGNQLLVGGLISKANWFGPGPRVDVSNIALWTGTTWDALGGGVNFEVHAIAAMQTPAGVRVFAGGSQFVSSTERPRLAMWDGQRWTAFWGLAGTRVEGLAVYDADGEGPLPQQLIIGGDLTTLNSAPINNIVALSLPRVCDSVDFNRNGVFPEDADVIAFFSVLAGEACASCSDIDFNNNGVFPEEQDVLDLLTVLAGGACS